MQIVSSSDNLHETSNHIFCEIKKKTYFKLSSAEFFTQHAKCKKKDSLPFSALVSFGNM